MQNQQSLYHASADVETAVPLLPSRGTQAQSPFASSSQSLLQSFVAGALLGTVIAGIMYASVAAMLLNFRETPELQIAFSKVIFIILTIGSHLGDVSYILVCLGLGVILTRRGCNSFQRFLNKNSTEQVWDARSVFCFAVCLEGGFLFGYSLMGLMVELLVGAPLSVAPFVFASVLDATVCTLLIRCYEWAWTSKSSH